VDTSNRLQLNKSGAISLQLLVIMVPVIFGFMGFAIDLGRMYLVRAELHQAANAMALAAAKQLIGTSGATANADAAALSTYNNADLTANKYNFGSQIIGDDSGFLQTETNSTTYFALASDAMSTDPNATANPADGTTAQYAQANITADAPLTFWALLSLGQSRKTPIAARAVAGISAPVCTACGVEPLAAAALDSTDTTNFGFAIGTEYTFGYQCTGVPTPTPLTGTAQRIPYLIVDRFNTGSTLDETQQLFSIGAAGLLPTGSTNLTAAGLTTYGCLTAVPGNTENVWATASPGACTAAAPPPSVQEMLCGLSVRMDTNTPTACTSVTDLSSISAPFLADTDVTNPVTDYTTYAGNTRRIITIPIVNALGTAGMNVLGFREFLIEGSPGFDTNDPSDTNGRFIALYIGSPAPVKQGRFDGGCDATGGPGKVVLFQ
jgi:Flp pilus assembly protein TadG